MKLGLREANQRFSSVIRAVRDGEEVIITDRGRPFAVISPYREKPGLQRLIDRGELLPPAVSTPDWSSEPAKLRRGLTVAKLLARDRSR